MHRTTIAAGLVLASAFSVTAGTAAHAASPTDEAPLAVTAKGAPFSVAARVSENEPVQGHRIRFRGSVTPVVPGTKVTLQLRYSGQRSWKDVDTRGLSPDGWFRFHDRVSTVRKRRYRVVAAPTDGHAAGRSASLKVTVFGWRDLTSLSPATYSGFGEVADGVKMNGVAYPSSLRSYAAYPAGTPSSIDYNLDRACKLFRGVAGLDDSSPAAGTAQIQMSADGTVRYTGAFGLTQAAPVAFDVTQVFRLTVAATPANGGAAAVGTPQVLCSF